MLSAVHKRKELGVPGSCPPRSLLQGLQPQVRNMPKEHRAGVQRSPALKWEGETGTNLRPGLTELSHEDQ